MPQGSLPLQCEDSPEKADSTATEMVVDSCQLTADREIERAEIRDFGLIFAGIARESVGAVGVPTYVPWSY